MQLQRHFGVLPVSEATRLVRITTPSAEACDGQQPRLAAGQAAGFKGPDADVTSKASTAPWRCYAKLASSYV